MSAAFAFQLAQLRRATGISQRKAAADLQVSQALLSHYEKGIREPGLDFVVRAADYYHVSCDLLLGRRDTVRQSELLQAAAPSQYARETERDIRNTLDIIFDLLSRCYDPNVFCYASIYVSEVLYELLRHLSRISGDCVSERYSLTDEAFDSGAVVSDITLARARYILAVKKLGESGRDLTTLQYDDMEERYGPQRMQSLARLLSLVEHRIARQNLAENAAYNKMFRLEYPPMPAGSDALYSDSKEEGSL